MATDARKSDVDLLKLINVLSRGAPICGLTVGDILMIGCHHGVREPERASPNGGILDMHERRDRAVARIIGGHHSTMTAEETEPIGDLD